MPEPVIGRDFAASLIEEFWRAFVVNAAMTAHVDLDPGAQRPSRRRRRFSKPAPSRFTPPPARLATR